MKAKSRSGSTENDDPPAKRVKLETENDNHGADAIKTEEKTETDANGSTTGTEQTKVAPKHNYGVFYCPLKEDAAKTAYESQHAKVIFSEKL